MKHCITLTMIATLGLALGTAATGQEKDAMDRVPKPKSGETRHCLSMSRIDRIEVVDDQTLVFHMHGKDKYVNHLPYRCPGLKRNSFIHETSMNSYCDLDIISVVDLRLGMRMGSCPLGPFEKVTGELDLD